MRKFLTAVFLLPIGLLAQSPSPVISDPSTLTAAYERLMGVWFSRLMPYAFDLFAALALLEFGFLGWNLWKTYNGDIRTTLFGLTNKVLMVGMFLALLQNAGPWMSAIINDFVTMGKNASGVTALNPSVLLLQGFKVFGGLLPSAFKHGLLTDFPTAIALLGGGAVIVVSFLIISIQFVVAKVETFLALGAGVIMLAGGGSSWTTPYAERYFSYSIGAGVKLMMLYLCVGAGWDISNTWIAQAQNMPWTQAGVESAWIIAAGAVMFAAICWFIPHHIGGMLGGSPNLSHSDLFALIGPAVSAAVTGAMVTAGVGTAAAAAGKAAAASAGGGALTAGGKPAAGGQTPQSTPSGNGNGNGAKGGGAKGGVGAAVLNGAGQMASAAVGAVRQMPHGGSHGTPPRFNGFNH